MSQESRLRKYLTDNVDAVVHLSPIECHASQPGFPDYSYTVRGVNGQLELKSGSKRKPPEFRPTQYAWIKRNLKHGGNPLILVHLNIDGTDVFGLIHGAAIDAIHKRPGIQPWIRNSTAKWESSIDWPVFIDHLQHPEKLNERNQTK